eukprot:12902755-Prorocentrum_lima.AAC.1
MKRASSGNVWTAIGSHIKRAKDEIHFEERLAASSSGQSTFARSNRMGRQEVLVEANMLAAALLQQ